MRHGVLAISALVVALLQPITSHAGDVAYINDWKWEGPAAPILLAQQQGFFEDVGLDISLEAGNGSVESIPKVASGEYQFGSADLNSLITWRAENPDSRMQAIFIIYNAPPFAVLGRRSLGVVGPTDLTGNTLGAPANDGAFAQWPAFAKANGINGDEVTIEDVSFAERESKLARGDVDAITGFSFTSYINLVGQDIPSHDISLMLMSDFGLDLYGNAIIVNPEFADQNPGAVNGFIKALTEGFKATLANPAGAIEHVLAANPEADRDTELRRLVMAIGHHIITDEVVENGLGAAENARLARAISQLGELHGLVDLPEPGDIFDSRYLPALELRQIPDIALAPPPTPSSAGND